MAKYHTFTVQYEHTTDTSDTVRQNRAVLTVWGESEFAIKKAIEREHPSHTNVVILESEERD